MSRTYKDSRGKSRAGSRPQGRQRRDDRLIVRGIRRRPVDVQKLGRALLDLAQAQAEAEAQAVNDRQDVGAGDRNTNANRGSSDG